MTFGQYKFGGSGGSGGTYKKYAALFNQSGTSAPVASEVFNDLGVITTQYDSTGSYSIKSAGLFTAGKTIYYNSQNYRNIGKEITYLYYVDSSTIAIETIDDGVSGNGILIDTTFVIEVYD